MRNLKAEAISQYREIIGKAIAAAMEKGTLPKGECPEFIVEIPADSKNGDLASNAAMASAKVFHMAPRAIADAIATEMDLGGSFFGKCEVAGPGFLNVYFDPAWYGEAVSTAIGEGDEYGRSDYGKGEKIMVEFVSANPTGPMHLGNARGGAIGDCLAETLSWAGYDVTREFYINDAGNQIAKFGRSLEARYLQHYLGEDAVEFPEEGYHGADITERAEQFAEINGDRYVNADSEERQKALIDFALPKNIEGLKNDLHKYRIDYDVWFHESSLYENGSVDKVVKILTDKGLTYEQDGALWYRNAQVVADILRKEGKTEKQIEDLELKDDVLIRANGNPTYFAGDIAYHYNKFAERGFDRVINVWGADHHGHVARLKGAMDAVGLSGDRLDVVLMQLVELVRDGKPVRMSKRTGKAITLVTLLDEVSIDAARFLFNYREPNTHLLFDLDLAIEQSSQNPVYYVQYAHARICSILKALADEGIELEKADYVYTEPEELALVSQIAAFPAMIVDAAKSYDPSKVTKYAVDLASQFHKFYNACHVRVDDRNVMNSRMALCLAAKNTIHNVLSMLKVDIPEKM